MLHFSRRRPTLVVCLAVALLALQTVSALSASALTGNSSQLPSENVPSSSAPLTPDYLIMGQVKGSSLVQSDLPRSVPLAEGVQFADTYYGAEELETAYGASALFASGFDGRGQTIAVIDAYGDPTINQDIAAYDRLFGLPAANLTVIPVGPYAPELGITTGWDAETALDVEASHAMAPYAHIDLVVGANASNALFEAVAMVVDEHLANVVSMSWGEGENLFEESGFSASGFLNYPYLDYYFQKGAAEGITFLAATGDYGAFGGTTTVTSYFPASSPFVTGVGGTTLFLIPTSGLLSDLNSSAEYQGEDAWSVSPQYVGEQGVSSGGGYSELFPQPSYQAGAITSASRTSPDVAADANPYTGSVVVLEGQEYSIGGTSLATPLWAGMVADLDQYVGRSLGLLNPYLYSIYSDRAAYESAFHQVTLGFNGEYEAGPGYNLVTGLGSPNLPQLASEIKGEPQGLNVTVSTSQGSSSAAPAQYSYGETFTIAAAVETPEGVPVSSGSFTAMVESVSGTVATVPLSYNGSSWVGTMAVGPGDPPNSWTITVSGTAGEYSGTGIADVDIGASIAILTPIPYPYALPISDDAAFQISVSAAYPNGTNANTAALTAYLVYSGEVISSVALKLVESGIYAATAKVSPSQPQGTYALVVNETGFGSAYSYFYVGEAVTGVMITPNDEAIPSVSAGEQVTLLARTETTAGAGVYTSNVTANIYSLSGALMASVTLEPAPNKVQFGVFDFFGYNQANYTIPPTLTQGFYKLQFLSSFASDGTPGTQLGNFTTGFYVSGPPLSYTISAPSTVFEGQDVVVSAQITDSTGLPVMSGVFTATFIPSGYTYEAYLSDYLGYTGVPMQYVPAVGVWEGVFQIPSVLTSANAFLGNGLTPVAGPWTIFVAGESSVALNALPSNSYVEVLPLTYYTETSLSQSNVQTAPLVAANGTSYRLDNVAAGSLSVSGLNITLSDDYFGNLTIANSTIRLVGTVVGNVNASGSSVAMLQGSEAGTVSLNSTKLLVVGSTFKQLSPARPLVAEAGLSQVISGNANFSVTFAGKQLLADSIVGTVDGAPIHLTISTTPVGLSASGTINATSLADGVHTLVVQVEQSDGFYTNSTVLFSTDAKAVSLSKQISSLTSQTDLLTVLVVVLAALTAALAYAVISSRRKPQTPPAAAPAAGQT